MIMVFGLQLAEWTSSQRRMIFLGGFMAFVRWLRVLGYCVNVINRKFIGCPCSHSHGIHVVSQQQASYPDSNQLLFGLCGLWKQQLQSDNEIII